MQNLNLHVIGNHDFTCEILPGNVPLLRIGVGIFKVDIFLHEGKADSALEAITEAIRVYQMEREGSDGDTYMDTK